MLQVLLIRNYALLWTAALISGIGNFVLLAALPYFVYATSGSALASGGAFMSEVLPMLLFPALGGVYADRWARKPVLASSDWLRGLLVLPLIAVHGVSTLWIVYLFGFLTAAVGNFAGPFGSASIPHVVREDDLATANAAFSVGANIAVIVGFPLGGILLQHVGLSAVVLVDSLSYILSGLLVGSVTVQLESSHMAASPDRSSPVRQAWLDWTLGMAIVRRERWMVLLFVVVALTFLGNGAVWTALPAFVKAVLGGSPQFYSWVLTAQGAGGVLAGMGVGFAMKRASAVQTLAFGLLFLGALPILIAVAASRPVTLMGFFLAGPPALFAVAGLNTILQAEVPPEYRGRIFGLYLTINALASLLGSLLAGTFTDTVGSRLVLGAAGRLVLGAGTVAVLALAPALQGICSR